MEASGTPCSAGAPPHTHTQKGLFLPPLGLSSLSAHTCVFPSKLPLFTLFRRVGAHWTSSSSTPPSSLPLT